MSTNKAYDKRFAVDRYYTYDDHVIINGDDQDLRPIKISISDIWKRTFEMYGYKAPKMPKSGLIDGRTLKPHRQKFNARELYKYPEKFVVLESKLRTLAKTHTETKHKSFSFKEQWIINRFWKTIYDSPDEWKDEIKYIKLMWYFRLFGYWFFNNGVPTYMTGTNFIYVMFYHIRTSTGRIVLPDYRDRDRRWFLFQQFTKTDTTTFAKMDKDGWAISDEYGNYEMKDIFTRTSYGNITSKPRRVGDTSKSGCTEIVGVTQSVESQFGNQAVDDNSAERVFLHYINTPFNKFPLILKPLQTQLNPKAELVFDSDDPKVGLGSWIDFATTKSRSAYDGATLRQYYSDEAGKIKYESVVARHGTVKLCLSDRDVIYGDCMYTTTVEDMDGTAADEFMKLSKDSMYHQRKENGQTKSGMYVGFFPAHDGHPSFIDEYGMSIINTPTPQQAKFINKAVGAKEYLNANRKLLTGTELALEKRQNPITYRECFSPDPKNQLYPNVAEIQQRIVDLKFETDLYRVGDFEWESKRFGKVIWVDNPLGKFTYSLDLKPHEINKWKIVGGIKYPAIPDKFVGCGDPFRVEKTDSSRMSKGGFSGFYLRDYTLDPEGKDVKDFVSQRYFLDYLEKADFLAQDTYVEDLLKACIYCGMMMYPENNIPVINEKFKEWGFEGYLLYDVDPFTNAIKNNAGFTGSTGSKPKMFNLHRDHLKDHVLRERHYRILEQALALRSLDDLKNQDLLAAAQGNLLGVQSVYAQYLKEDMNTSTDTTGWVPTYEC